jgi:N-methylhydantoinase A
VAQQSSFPNILTCDVGGTSTDVALCRGGAPEITRQTRVGDLSVHVPSVDVRSVGAGGGSIAHVPPLTRALRVGPRSAGAEPGPACYDRGGVEPTVTDANVVLGYLPPRLLGGDMVLDVEAAKRAVQHIADALDLDLMQAAAGIVHIANENMLGALRLVSVQRGFDPRDFALMAFGGAGPLHANARTPDWGHTRDHPARTRPAVRAGRRLLELSRGVLAERAAHLRQHDCRFARHRPGGAWLARTRMAGTPRHRAV